MIKLSQLKITDLFGKYDIKWDFNEVASVLVGDNGVGKSTILQILYALLQPNSLDNNPKLLELFGTANLLLNNGVGISIINKKKEINQEGRDLIVRALSDKKFIEGIKKKIDLDIRFKDEIDRIKAKDKLEQAIQDIISQETKEESTFSIIGREVSIRLTDEEGKTKNGDFISRSINAELISTLFMSANSINEVKGSDGNTFRVLDMEIANQISRLSKYKNTEKLKEVFIKNINEFLDGKFAFFKGNRLLFNLQDEESNNILFSALSSGERQLVYILLKAIISLAEKDKLTVLIMDEPEISLHLNWQEKLLNCLNNISPKTQIILATHSPAIVMNGWMDSYKEINDIYLEK